MSMSKQWPQMAVGTRPRPNVGIARAVIGPPGPQGPPGPGINYRGYWVPGTAYTVGDAVTYLGLLYIADSDFVSTVAPDSDPSNWSVLQATAGPQGPQGLAGPQGVMGRGLEAIQGTLGSTALLPPPASAQIGDAWIIGDDLWILK